MLNLTARSVWVLPDDLSKQEQVPNNTMFAEPSFVSKDVACGSVEVDSTQPSDSSRKMGEVKHVCVHHPP